MSFALALLSACQPWRGLAPPPPCERIRPEPGERIVEVVGCSEVVPAQGEGRSGADLYLANHEWRIVIRHPFEALTARGLGGGTVLDAAPWGEPDTIHEVIPVVDGGWLQQPTMTLEEDGLSFEGTLGPLPDLPPPTAAGERRTVRYRVAPDDPFLEVEGAEGFWIHPREDSTLFGGLAVTEGRAVGAAGEVTDLGGAFLVVGTDRLLVSTDTAAWGELPPATQTIAGRAPRAETIALYRGDTLAGRVPIVPPAFSFRADAAIDGVRAEAPGYAPSPLAPPGRDLSLDLGGSGTLTLRPTWDDGLPHWFRARWTSADGRTDTRILDPEGGPLPLGEGAHTLEISAGPAFETVTLHVELAPDEQRELPLRLPLQVPAGPHALAGFRRPADRSRDWRGSDRTAAREAAADGLSYVTFAPPDDIASIASNEDGFPRIRARAGVLLRGDGYSVAAWPWIENGRTALHGGPRLPVADPKDAAALLSGGPDDARTLHVDLGWLARVGPPFAVTPPPALVALEHPGPSAIAWAPWLAWLDAHRPLTPTGPATWVRVADPALLGSADIEQALARGSVCAGNGPLVALLVDGFPPGEQAPVPTGTTDDTSATRDTSTTRDTGATAPPTYNVLVTVSPMARIDHVALLGSDGLLIPLPPLQQNATDLALPGSWIAAAAWSDDPEGPWAVTGPVWLRAP